MNLIKLILWIGFAITHGVYDAYLYEFRIYATLSAKSQLRNPHIMANLMRAFICIGLSIPENPNLSLIYILIWLSQAICLMLIFSFWHNGFYFESRNKWEPSLDYKFTSSFGKNSIAKLNFDFKERVIMLILGLGTLIWLWYL